MYTADDVKKLMKFEGLMFLLFGIFWASAMFLPLFISGSLSNKKDFSQNLLIMFGFYLLYVVCRVVFLLGRSFVNAYQISNDPEKTPEEKRRAEEWMTFLLMVPLWGGVIAWPLAINEYFVKAVKIPFAVLIIILPYVLYWVTRKLLLKN